LPDTYNSASIETNVEKVFKFLADPENIPLWNYYIKEVSKISPGTIEIGARFHQIRKNDEQTFEITKFQKNKIIEFTTDSSSSIQFKRQLIFQEKNSHCLVEDHFELDTGYPLFLQKLFSKMIKKSIKENLIKLKQLLETGRTVLQDGRVISWEDNCN